MAVTVELALSGNWEILYTNSGAVNVPIVLTPREDGVNWAVREDTTLPAAGFSGHTLDPNFDRQRIVQPGETLFVRGQASAVLYHSIGG